MVPSGKPTDDTVAELLGLLAPGDAIVDGGNSNYKDSQARYALAKAKGVAFIDAGTSGGVWGLANGYCLMVGGDEAAVRRVEPIFTTLAPPNGYAYVGPSGAGHFSKMVHNGIEYGMLAAYGEGFEILEKSAVHVRPAPTRRTLAARQRGAFLAARTGRIGLPRGSELADIRGYVDDSGEGRWTVQAAIDENVPAPVITMALLSRFVSRQAGIVQR
jgi:6-phosphogluconate dehydrogenase